MDSGQVLTLVRQTLADLDSTNSGRWQDSTLLNWIDRTNKDLVGMTRFPDSRIITPTVSGQQLYQFPLFLKVKAIYVAGMPIDPSDLPTLEGRQIGAWDATSDGTITSGPGGDFALIGTANLQAPQWSVQEPLSYPTGPEGTWVTPAPDAQPWTFGQRPRYYWRGGSLGLVPPPGNVTPVDIAVEGVRQPDTIIAQGQAMTTPDNYMSGIVWGSLYWAFFSNNDENSRRQSAECEKRFEREKRLLVSWRGEYPGDQPSAPKPRTLRPASSAFNVRRNRYGYR